MHLIPEGWGSTYEYSRIWLVRAVQAQIMGISNISVQRHAMTFALHAACVFHQVAGSNQACHIRVSALSQRTRCVDVHSIRARRIS